MTLAIQPLTVVICVTTYTVSFYYPPYTGYKFVSLFIRLILVSDISLNRPYLVWIISGQTRLIDDNGLIQAPS